MTGIPTVPKTCSRRGQGGDRRSDWGGDQWMCVEAASERCHSGDSREEGVRNTKAVRVRVFRETEPTGDVYRDTMLPGIGSAEKSQDREPAG